jgi:threonylcarbamoyladenosine tRNA methylthiotransferase CDKAL1
MLLMYRRSGMATRVFIRNFGCTANLADGEVLAGCLAQAGFELVAAEALADVVVYNSCAVKGPTENRVVDALQRVPASKKVVVAGCLPQVSFERLQREVRFDGVVGAGVGCGVVDVVRRVVAGEHVVELQNANVALSSLELPRIRLSRVVSLVPVGSGCLGSCAYCCVVHARGRLRSYRVDEVVERVRGDVAGGAKEVWLTSQDVACYGLDIGSNVARLLQAVCAVEGEFRVRVGMMTPNILQPFLDELVETYRNAKVFKFVHLPVQSGDDGVLAKMRRFYTAAEFRAMVATFRAVFPDLTLSTDVICGFPGESALAIENTLNLLREVKPDVVNVSKFFARPKTAAWEMRDEAVERGEIKRRSTETAALAKQLALGRNQRWVSWSGEILVDEKGKVAGSWVGRNFAYKPIAVKCEADLLGKTVQVKIVKGFSTHLLGQIKQP